MKNPKFFLLICTVLMLFSKCVYSQAWVATQKTITEEQLKQLVQETETKINSILKKEIYLPGVAVTIVSRDRVLWTKAYGYRDKSRTAKVDTNTIFGVLSVSKPITVTGLMMAEQEGLIDLDIPIRHYLPKFTIQSRFPDDPMSKITIRHLISMTSGLTHDAPIGNNADAFSPSYKDHIHSFSQTWLRFRPGERAEYSGMGTELAAYCLEQVIHKPFTEYIQKKIFDPLGMKRSTYDIQKIKDDSNRATGNNKNFESVPIEIPMLAPAGVYSSIADMSRFIQFHLNFGKINGTVILQEQKIKQMQTIPFPMQDQIAGYTQGLQVSYYHLGGQEVRCMEHGGGGFGFRCQMKWLPDLGYGVMVMTNSQDHNNVNENLTEEILLKIVELLTEKKNLDPSDWLNSHLPSRSVVSCFLPNNLEGNYNGSYHDLHFLIKDSTFGYESGTTFVPVIPISRYEYISRDYLYRFNLDGEGKPVSVVRPYDGMVWNISERKGDPKGPDKKEWKQYVGTYVRKRYGLSERFYNVIMKNGWLHFIGGGLDYRLKEFNPGLFYLTDGDVVDFNAKIPTYRNLKLYKVCD